MFIVIHVVIALLSLIQSAVVLISPSRTALRMGYGFIVATLLSGVLLVVTIHAQLVPSCLTGLGYLVTVSIFTGFARKRLFN